MKKLTILHLINGFGNSSITRIVRDLVHYLGSNSFTWHVGGLSGPDDMHDEIEALGATVLDFALPGTRSAKTAQRIRKYCTEHRIDVVHTHTPRTILMFLRAFGGRRRPLHVATKHILNAPGDRRWGTLYSLADRLLLYFPDHLVPVSDKVYQEIMACPGLDRNRVTMIRNAVNAEPFHVPGQRDSCREEFGFAPDDLVVGSTGRLEKVKRFDLLIQGFSTYLARCPRARLLLVGEGGLRRELEQCACSAGISHAVSFTGFRTDIPRLLAAMDIYVQSSANEGLSLSILEAMAAGKPVVITDVGGARELVEHGKTGILIPPGSASAIATALLSLTEDPTGMATLARSGRDYIIHEFGLEKMMSSYRGLYETLAADLP